MKQLTPKVDNAPLTEAGRFPAAEFNQFAGEVETAITDSGQTLTDGVTNQLSTAIQAAGSPDVKRPVNVDPTNGATVAATSPTLTGSEYQSLYDRAHQSSQFRIATDSAMTALVYDSGVIAATTVHTIITPIAANNTYFFDIQYTDEDGFVSELSASTTFLVPLSLVQTPTNQTPVEGDLTIGEQVTVTSSAFTSVPVSTHDASQWQISTDQTFVSVDFDSGIDLTNLVSFTQAGLTIGETQYFWRVKHRSATLGFSAFSAPTSFTTVAESVDVPTNISPADAATGIASSVLLQGSSFSTIPVSGQSHIATQWQVATDSGFTSIVFDSGEDAVNLESIVATGLSAGTTTHFWRVRYKGDISGFTDYSTVTTFVTLQDFADWSLWDGTADGVIQQTSVINTSLAHPSRVSAFIGNDRFISVTRAVSNPNFELKVVASFGLSLASGTVEVTTPGGTLGAWGITRLTDDISMFFYAVTSLVKVHIITTSGNSITVGAQQALSTASLAGTNTFNIEGIDATNALLVVGRSTDTDAHVLSVTGDTVAIGAALTLAGTGFGLGAKGTIDVRGTKALLARRGTANANLTIDVLDIDTGANTVSDAATINTADPGDTDRHYATWINDDEFVVMYRNLSVSTYDTILASYDGASTISISSISSFESGQTSSDRGISVIPVSANEIMFAYGETVSSDIFVRHAFISSGNIFYGTAISIDPGPIAATVSAVDLKQIDDGRILASWGGTTGNTGLRNLILNGSV